MRKTITRSLPAFVLLATLGSGLLWMLNSRTEGQAPAAQPSVSNTAPAQEPSAPVQANVPEKAITEAKVNELPHAEHLQAGKKEAKKEKNKIPLRTRMDLAMKQEFDRTKDPALGRVPRERLYESWKYAQSLMNQTDAPIAGVDWTERGPSNVAGRSRTLIVDPNDGTGNTVFAASVSGGLWRTTDITANPPVWTAIDNFMGNLAITSIAVDPSNTNIWYLTTGEAYLNIDAVRGDGVWRSTNGGATWTQLASTTGATFDYCTQVRVTSTGVVLVATVNTGGGLQRSTNGGTSWTRVLGTGLGITGAASNNCWDVEIAANGDVYASLEGTMHKSVDGGATWAGAMTMPITLSRTEIACAPSDANYVYAAVELGNAVNGILRTTNGGTTWTSRTEPDDADPGVPNTDFSNGQAWYNLTIAVDPNNRDVLMVGGLDLFKSSDGAATWTQIAHWYGGFSFQYVHADQHYILYRPGSSSVAYFANDGGIYRSTNADNASPTITFKGDNFNVTQFYACALHPTAFSDYSLAGSQDNGTHQFSGAGINSTIEVTGGDGAFCHIDQNQPQFQFTQYIYNDYYRSTDNGNSWTNITVGSTGQFINPTDYDNAANIMYCTHSAGNYLRWDDPQTGASFTPVAVAAFGGNQVNAVTVSPNTANRVFFGMISNGDVVRVDNANGAGAGTNISTGLPAGTVSCVEVETGNDNHLLVTYSNYGTNSVWESVNGGTSWTSVEGNLPDMPIRWALFNPNNNDQAMVATELGVWTTDDLNGGATVWGPSNTGLANVRVDMLQLRQSDDLVIAATHGRGLYSSDIFTAPTALFSATPLLTYTTRTVTFTDQSYNATSWSWNFGDGNTSTLQNPTHVYASAGKFNITLTINAGASTLTRTGYIHVLPDRGTPYVVATDGSTFEINVDDFGSTSISGTTNFWERGVPTNTLTTVNSPVNAWKTDLDANITNSANVCALQTPSYNLTTAGVYTLRFRRSSNAAFSNAPYGLQVHVSTDKGLTWARLGTCPDALGTNWYNRGPCGTSLSAAIFSDGIGFLNTVNNQLASYNISAFAGNANVSFRFVFSVTSGSSGYLDGFMIDDFEILGPSNAPNVLPATLSQLTGAWVGPDVQLNWGTYTENNVRGFNIERSVNGSQFEAIGFETGALLSTQAIQYDWLDQAPPADHLWYRIAQEDLDGSIQYSNTVEVLRSEAGAQLLSLFPNPVQNELTAIFSSQPEGEMMITVTDVTGRVMRQQAITPDSHVLRLSGIDFTPGNYFIEFNNGNRREVRRFVKE